MLFTKDIKTLKFTTTRLQIHYNKAITQKVTINSNKQRQTKIWVIPQKYKQQQTKYKKTFTS
ncbi:hypothetical protein HMPREF3230_00825 [Gardnerella vaginalis]|uniref:Uncharacterized protein n=1 Tax=Gardnerella vaginalis TaxID=2702 RepID=A0A135Z5G2_GARVA|nr:hypothetical protein HMPREF3230_00825 [Gardnerella vaginalis]